MIAYDEGGVIIHLGDCREVLATLPDASIDAVVTDPPYGIGFMGREWDTFAPGEVRRQVVSRERKHTKRTSARYPDKVGHQTQGGGVPIYYDESASGDQRFQAWVEEWARECLRVLKPGGHVAVFGGSRTFHRLTCGIEDAGFQIRDVLTWLYGSGFPKSRNLDGDWQGWGTALKPGWEPIILARKPLIGTVAANVAEHGTGALNIDGCRIGGGTPRSINANPGMVGGNFGAATYESGSYTSRETSEGRWPANVVLDEAAAELLDQQSGASASRIGKPRGSAQPGDGWGMTITGAEYDDFGGASRFFYTAKASRSERNAGLSNREAKPLNWSAGTQNPGSFQSPGTDRSAKNHHPTVKPLALMRWLVRLVTPPGGVICDPFGGSGTTAVAAYQEGFRAVLIEREPEYVEIEIGRIRHAQKHGRQARLNWEEVA